MKICPHCGAESADNSTFCSLCLARFDAGGAPPRPAAPPVSGPGTAAAAPPQQQAPAYPPPQQPPQQTAPAYPPPQQQEQEYVSPSDYHALAREMQQQTNSYPGYRDSAYYGAAMNNPGAVPAISIPAGAQKRSTLDIILMVLLYSLGMYAIMFCVNFLIGMFLVGAAFGGSEGGFSFGIAMRYIGDAFLLILAGYVISAKAMERNRGWIYGLACVAAMIFFWEPLVGFLLILFMTGEVYIPVFTLLGIVIALFLGLPLGALGGWIAEKRYMG